MHALEAYQTPRTYWGTRRAVSIADMLLPELTREQEAGRITLCTNTRLRSLEAQDGTVTGGWVQPHGEAVRPVRVAHPAR